MDVQEQKGPGRLRIDREYFFSGLGNCESVCRLRVYDKPDGAVVVIVTELDENPGTSITNFEDELATWVVKDFNLPTNKLTWVEHYPDRGEPGAIWSSEEFSLVQFQYDARLKRFSCPEWKYLPREKAEQLTGCPIE